MSSYYNSVYDPNGSDRQKNTPEPYTYKSKKSYGGYNPTLRSTAEHDKDWVSEVYRNQFGQNADNYDNYDTETKGIMEYMNQGNSREDTFDYMMEMGLGDEHKDQPYAKTYNKDFQDLYVNNDSYNGYDPIMRSTAVQDYDWLGDVYRNQFGIEPNSNDKYDKERKFILDYGDEQGYNRDQLFNRMMEYYIGQPGPNIKTAGMLNRDLTQEEKDQLMKENPLTAFGGFEFGGDQYLEGNTFRNNMYNKGGQYLNEQQRIMNEAEQARLDELAVATSDERFNELTNFYETKETDRIAAEQAEIARIAAEKEERLAAMQEQNNRNIKGRLSQKRNKTNDYMLYLKENNIQMYERIMESLKTSNPEMYQTISDVTGE